MLLPARLVVKFSTFSSHWGRDTKICSSFSIPFTKPIFSWEVGRIWRKRRYREEEKMVSERQKVLILRCNSRKSRQNALLSSFILSVVFSFLLHYFCSFFYLKGPFGLSLLPGLKWLRPKHNPSPLPLSSRATPFGNFLPSLRQLSVCLLTFQSSSVRTGETRVFSTCNAYLAPVNTSLSSLVYISLSSLLSLTVIDTRRDDDRRTRAQEQEQGSRQRSNSLRVCPPFLSSKKLVVVVLVVYCTNCSNYYLLCRGSSPFGVVPSPFVVKTLVLVFSHHVFCAQWSE